MNASMSVVHAGGGGGEEIMQWGTCASVRVSGSLSLLVPSWQAHGHPTSAEGSG